MRTLAAGVLLLDLKNGAAARTSMAIRSTANGLCCAIKIARTNRDVARANY